MKTFFVSPVVGCVGFSLSGWAQGMSPEARKNIHLLFNQHETATRTVTMTRNGYVALTESADPKVAAANAQPASRSQNSQ